MSEAAGDNAGHCRRRPDRGDRAVHVGDHTDDDQRRNDQHERHDVLRVVTPGSASSLIVRETRPGAEMYVNLTGDRATKSEMIRAWVVANGAAENR